MGATAGKSVMGSLPGDTPLVDFDGNPKVCSRHGVTLTVAERTCWECNAERTIAEREEQERIDVATFKMNRDMAILGARAAHPVNPNPASEKQVNFIAALRAERNLTPLTDEDKATLTKAAASQAITKLLATPKPAPAPKAPTTTATPWPNVVAGHYALRTEDGVKFYQVDRPTEGKWAGYTFLAAQASDERWPIKNRETKQAVMDAIAADPAGAARLYGLELGVCGICSRTLTDETSRAYGIGPVCRDKTGW